MKKTGTYFQDYLPVWPLLRWSLMALPVALVTGSAVALFLWLLDRATNIRSDSGWLLFLLPLAGVLIHFIYKFVGKNAEAGNNLIIDEIHQPGGGVPARMTPLILLTTVITHLFGGSAGREGTAVQMGGSLAALAGKLFKLSPEDLRMLLMTGIAAGFGAVFGTPVAGAIFALEVLIAGRIEHRALLPCIVGAVAADIVCAAWGIHHTQHYINPLATPVNLWTLIPKILLAGMLFGIVARLFSLASHGIKTLARKYISIDWLIPFTGGCLIILLTFMVGSRDYLGLGVTNPDPYGVSIVSSFHTGGAGILSWLWKLIFTAATLGTGFKGGEVTPLFFMGASLGNAFASVTDSPVDLMAGLGFIAVFAGATNTPIACTFMGVELFGGQHVLWYALACFTAYYFSGSSGIYTSQKLSVKMGGKSTNDKPASTMNTPEKNKL